MLWCRSLRIRGLFHRRPERLSSISFPHCPSMLLLRQCSDACVGRGPICSQCSQGTPFNYQHSSRTEVDISHLYFLLSGVPSRPVGILFERERIEMTPDCTGKRLLRCNWNENAAYYRSNNQDIYCRALRVSLNPGQFLQDLSPSSAATTALFEDDKITTIASLDQIYRHANACTFDQLLETRLLSISNSPDIPAPMITTAARVWSLLPTGTSGHGLGSAIFEFSTGNKSEMRLY